MCLKLERKLQVLQFLSLDSGQMRLFLEFVSLESDSMSRFVDALVDRVEISRKSQLRGSGRRMSDEIGICW